MEKNDLLAEYYKQKLLHLVLQYFNLGLILVEYFYMDIPSKKMDFPFLTHCRLLPRLDVFISGENYIKTVIGRIDIPQQWVREFVSRMKLIRETYPEITLRYTFESQTIAKWNLSLMDTYY